MVAYYISLYGSCVKQSIIQNVSLSNFKASFLKKIKIQSILVASTKAAKLLRLNLS